MIKYVKSIIIVTFLLTSGCGFNNMSPPPSDDELINIFKDNREIFNQLVTSIQKDGFFIVSYDPKWSDPENIPLEKKEMYYDLLKIIDARQIIKRGPFADIPAWGVGLGGDGDGKGYTYRPNTNNEVVDSLDNFTSTGKAEYLMRDIGEGWYLYYEHVP